MSNSLIRLLAEAFDGDPGTPTRVLPDDRGISPLKIHNSRAGSATMLPNASRGHAGVRLPAFFPRRKRRQPLAITGGGV